MFRWQTLVASAVAVIAAATLGLMYRSADSTDQEMELVAAEGSDPGSGTFAFTVRAAPVDGLYPGAERKLNLTLTNPYSFDLQITAIDADLVATSNPGCEPIASNLEVQPFTGAVPSTVPARDSTEAGAVPLRMPNTVANDCQEAVFTITLTADAARIGQ